MTIAIRASGNAHSLHHHEEEHELNEHQIVDSSFTAIINASIDKVAFGWVGSTTALGAVVRKP